MKTELKILYQKRKRQRIPRKEKKFRKKLEPKVLALLEKELKPYKTRFWGVDYHISPAFVQDGNGDGLQLIWLSSIDTRPQFYVLRIDSHWDVNADDFDLEYMLTLIAENYGEVDQYVCIDCENNIYVMEGDEDDPNADKYTLDDLSFPMLRWGGGALGLIKNFRTGKVGRN